MYMGAEDRPVEGCIEGERVREGGPHTVAYRRLFTLLTYKGNHDTRGRGGGESPRSQGISFLTNRYPNPLLILLRPPPPPPPVSCQTDSF